MSNHGPRRRRSRAKRPGGLPKGAHRRPDGNYVVQSVGPPDKRGRRLRIRAVHRSEPDATKVAQALIAIAIEQAQGPADH